MRKILILPLLLLTLAAIAQPKQNAPYSRFGLGNPVPQVFASQLGMGGISAAFHDPYHLNVSNPASFAFLRTATLETGLYAQKSQYEASNASQTEWTGNLGYFALGFALKSPINEVMDKKQSDWQFGMGFSLMPSTLIGYNIETTDTLPSLGIVTNSFTGNGGTYRLNWSNAAKYKHTAVGVNFGWVFGKANYENTTVFQDSLPTYNDNFRDEMAVNGFVWKVGVQHDFVLEASANDKNVAAKWLTLGVTGSGQKNIRVENNVIRLRSRGALGNGQYRTPDTLSYVQGTPLDLTMPAAFSVALQYVNTTKFKIGVEYGYENGSAYNNQARADGVFQNASSFALGVEYTPDYTSYNKYLKRVRYRAGAYLRQDIRVINGADLNDMGVSIGGGFPIVLPRQQTSFINAALELGKIGANTPITESYFRVNVGFTLNDNSWFYQRRFE
ncbi:MAG: hypothetical protein IPL65_21790 [Lewinellaceae bacterium]|nr:hypothetical protein [Lewinellaceae bacterium]